MTLRLELQHFNGCPNGPTLLGRVREAIEKAGLNVEFVETMVEDEVTAAQVKFLGSPTLLINGQDLLGVPLAEQANLACRLYPAGLPSTDFIIQQMKVATFLPVR